MTAFPRSAGALPRLATPPRFPIGLQSWGASGRGQVRAVMNMGRTWDEVYGVLDTQNPSVRAFLTTLDRSVRQGIIWDVQHPYWMIRKGVGGGSPTTNGPLQIVSTPEDFSAWTNLGTPIMTSGQGDPFGGTAAWLMADDDAAALEGKQLAVTFTGNAVKALSLYAKAGTASELFVELRDQTAATNRFQCTITWSGGVPTISNLVGVFLRQETIPNAPGWYRFHFQTTSVTAANSHTWNIRIGPTPATVGNVYLFGANAWDSVGPAAYRGPSNPGPWALPSAQEGSSIYVIGAPSSTTAWLRQGDVIESASFPVVLDVTAQVDTDGAGSATIPISPPLFQPNFYVIHGAAIEINPTAIFMSAIVDKVSGLPDMDSTRYLASGLTVTWREVVP